MKLIVICSKCYKRAPVDPEAPPAAVTCVRCGHATPISISPKLLEEKVVRVCSVCGMGYLYVEKNFPGLLGCGVMLVAVVLFLAFNLKVWAMSFLMGAAALDYLVYRLVSNRVICYKCLTEYRGFKDNPDHRGFDLGTASRFAEGNDESDRGDQEKGA